MPKGKIFLIPSFLSPENTSDLLAPVILETIKNLDVFLVEEVRTARRFISKLKTGRKIEGLTFYQVNKHSDEASIRAIFKEISDEISVGVLSEAGCPGIADPGAAIVALGYTLGRKAVPLPGPSSVFMALMASGMQGQRFAFHGYLPIERKKRTDKIKSLEKAAMKGETQIFMETPYRNNPLLADLLTTLTPRTKLCIAAEITSPSEDIKTLTVQEWKKHQPDLHKKTVIFLVGA